MKEWILKINTSKKSNPGVSFTGQKFLVTMYGTDACNKHLNTLDIHFKLLIAL
jgi:hypothetical protein